MPLVFLQNITGFMRFADENVAELERRLPAPLLGRVPRLDEPTAAKASTYLELASLPGWPAKRA